jgi:hypothetical protein
MACATPTTESSWRSRQPSLYFLSLTKVNTYVKQHFSCCKRWLFSCRHRSRRTMMAAPAGSAPDLVGYSDDEIDSIEEHEQPSEEDEELVSSWVADLQEQQVQVVLWRRKKD